MNRRLSTPRRALGLSLLAALATAQQAPPPIDPAGVAGTRLLAGGGELSPRIRARFVDLAGGEGAAIVLIPTAADRADELEFRQQMRADWASQFPQATFSVLHTGDRATADSEAFTAPLRAAAGVWVARGQQQRLADAYVGTRTAREIDALLQRGGIVGGNSAGAAIMGRVMIAGDHPEAELATGLDLVPGAIVDRHFSQQQRLGRLLGALERQPGHFGLGIDAGTAVLLSGRRLSVLGDGTATLALAAGAGRAAKTLVLGDGEAADLVTWQRAARDRSGPQWPPDWLPAPNVARGALVIAGGGHIPDAISARFLELAGGKAARIVIVPTADGRVPMPANGFAEHLQRAGVTELRTLHWRHPREATPEQLALLADATAVWFGGGRHWRLCDAYEGTPALAAFRAVLDRGGVIGGNSAGASILSEFLVRGSPLSNLEVWCEGYDRGFGFLPGCAIDQHFLTRERTADLQLLIARFPQLVGIGIDEATAVVVQGSTMEVIGDSKVAVFDLRGPQLASPHEPHWLGAGDCWDLARGERSTR